MYMHFVSFLHSVHGPNISNYVHLKDTVRHIDQHEDVLRLTFIWIVLILMIMQFRTKQSYVTKFIYRTVTVGHLLYSFCFASHNTVPVMDIVVILIEQFVESFLDKVTNIVILARLVLEINLLCNLQRHKFFCSNYRNLCHGLSKLIFFKLCVIYKSLQLSQTNYIVAALVRSRNYTSLQSVKQHHRQWTKKRSQKAHKYVNLYFILLRQRINVQCLQQCVYNTN